MEEKDFQRINEIVNRSLGQLQEENRQEQQQFREENRKERLQFKNEIIDKFDRAIGTTEDNVQHKLDLVVEGQAALAERVDRLETRLDERIDGLGQRIDKVAVDLSAHRSDTEAHRQGWWVSEGA